MTSLQRGTPVVCHTQQTAKTEFGGSVAKSARCQLRDEGPAMNVSLQAWLVVTPIAVVVGSRVQAQEV